MIKNVLLYLTKIFKLCYTKHRIKRVRGDEDMSTFNQTLETMAKDILVSNDMLKLPVNLSVIAKNLDIDVYASELPKGISGAIRYNENKKKFEILLSEKESYERQRFTLAHELAHFFLEKRKLEESKEIHFDPLYRRNKNPEEKEVEYLAGAILMDHSMLKRLYNVNKSISLLAETFGVSESALTVRLMILGLI